MEVGGAIMQDLKKILKLVFVEAVKKREQALDDSVSALDSLLTKLETALNHGLKFRKRRLVVSWRSTKASPSFFSLLEELEQRLPFDPLLEGGDFWGTLGLQPVRELKWVTDPPSRLKIWLRQSLNVGLLGKRLRLVLEYPEILQKWYEPYGLLKNVDTVDDFISIVAALNAVGINLSLDPNVVLRVGNEVDTVLDVLSPIDSPCSSPEHSPHEGIKTFESWRDCFFQGFGDKEDSDRNAGEVLLLESPILSNENTNPVLESHRRVGLPATCSSSMFEFDTKSGSTSSEDTTRTQEVIRTDNNYLPSTHSFPDDNFGLGDWSEFTHDFGPPIQKEFVNLHEEGDIPREISKGGIYGSDSSKDIGEIFVSAGLMRPIQATGRPDLDNYDDDEDDDDDENCINEDNKRTLFDKYSTLCENGVGSGEVGMTEMPIQCVDEKNDASGSMEKHIFKIDNSCDQPSTYPEVLEYFEKQETTTVKSKIPSRSMTMGSCTCSSDLVYDDDDDEVLGNLDTIEGRCKSCNCQVTGPSKQTLPQEPVEVLTVTGNCSSSCNLKEVEFVPISTEIDALLAQPRISGFVALEVSAKSNNNSEQKGALSSSSSSDITERDTLLLGPDQVSRYVETAEVKETYVETILDMENVLLERDRLDVRCEPHFSQNPQEVSISQVDQDETSTASASMDITKLQSKKPSSSPSCNHQQVEILKVDVIGSHQQKGGASIGDWLVVGIQDFTLYHIRVHGSDAQIWEVDRRYKEFVTLQQQLSRLFSGRNDVSLPAPWDKVATETWKLIGNTSLHVIELRRALIQVCFQSLFEAGPPLSTAPPVLRFLLPSGRHVGAKSLNISTTTTATTFINSQLPGSLLPLEYIGSNPTLERLSASDILEPLVQPLFGKSIKLLTQVHKKKSMSQQLRIQHNECAGCQKELDVVTGVVSGLAQHFRLRGPQWCEYSGQLFCCVCHLNELAVLPALVLQHWDFSPQRVCQLAKAFLDSIYNQPMLCVSAVNPYLYSKVPILAHLRESRKRLSKIFSCIQCPSRTRMQSMVASRLYLLEDNDFFALRDLVDLSKGAFAVLPGFVQTLFERFSLHIKRECSICLALGEPCGANDFCNDPNDIIYPFQEDNVKRCSLCKLPFHKRCFMKIKSCPVCTRDYIQHKSQKAKAFSDGGLESIPECSNNATQ